MPNFWSTMLQQAYECFNRPRTVDYEFEKKAQELKLVKEKVYQVKSIITTFPQRTRDKRRKYILILVNK